jgi:hypothetical protein
MTEAAKQIATLHQDLGAKEEAVKTLTKDVAEWKEKYSAVLKDKDDLSAIVARLSEMGVRIPAEEVLPIDAKISRVDNEYGLVIINRGKMDGVKINYPFVIYRDGEFVAKATVMSLEDRVALARVDQSATAEGVEVKVGDDCTTRIRTFELPVSTSMR